MDGYSLGNLILLLVSISERFFDIMVKPNARALFDVILDIVSDRPLSRETEKTYFSDDDYYADENDLILRTPYNEATSKCLVETIGFMNVCLDFEAYLRHLRSEGISCAEEASTLILYDQLITNVSKELFDQRLKLGAHWQQSGPIELGIGACKFYSSKITYHTYSEILISRRLWNF